MEFGIIKKVELRSLWKNEETHFTPWLAQEKNLMILGEAIGLDLEPIDTEVSIGSFRADILARDGSGKDVIIENQLEKTDHNHLGQLVTYAAGIGARIVIWICQKVTDEHRQALDWLNEMTVGGVDFFACELEAWKIDDSRPAPMFKVVASPNDWVTQVRSHKAQGLTEAMQAHGKFWEAFRGFMSQKGSLLPLKNPLPQHWYPIRIGRSGFFLSLTRQVKRKLVGCELYIGGYRAKKAFHLLLQEKESIETELGPLDWQELPDKQDCRIIQTLPGDPSMEEEWPTLFAWMKERVEAFHRVLSPQVLALQLEKGEA
jgi:hypothetical protein